MAINYTTLTEQVVTLPAATGSGDVLTLTTPVGPKYVSLTPDATTAQIGDLGAGVVLTVGPRESVTLLDDATDHWRILKSNAYQITGNLVEDVKKDAVRAKKDIFLAAQDSNGTNAAAEKNGTLTTNKDYYAIDFDKTTDEFADWTVAVGDTAPTAVFYDIFWTTDATAAVAGTTVQFKITQDGVQNDGVLDAVGTAVTDIDTLLADGDLHVCTIAGTASEWKANGSVTIRLERDCTTGSNDTLDSDLQVLGVLCRLT